MIEAAECDSLATILNNWRSAISGQKPRNKKVTSTYFATLESLGNDQVKTHSLLAAPK
jgi:hypothetical protein